ncbi:MAG: SDR family NAD(P)-dependent oxidoreductase [bacterium]
MNSKKLGNNIAIVTGARRGIGKAIALELAKQGAKVVVSDIDEKECQLVVEEIKNLGSEGLAIKCDVSNQGDVEAMITKTIKEFGQLDIMVNNAGIVEFKPIEELSEADWQKTIDIDLKGVYLGSKIAAQEMVKKKYGKIINTASIAAKIGYPQISQYCAAKAGVCGFTRSLAVELAPLGINVNAVLPGVIDTPMAASIKDDPKVLEGTIAKVPKGRVGKPEDIANAVAFLASDDADYILGQEIVVDGGWTIAS